MLSPRPSVCAFAIVLAAGAAAARADFIPGQLVVSRMGNGTETLQNTGNSVFLDQYSPITLAQAAPGLTIALPAHSGSTRGIVSSGNATSEGALTLSSDARFLTYAGYDSTVGGVALAGSTSAAVNRVVARVDFTGGIDLTGFSDAFSANNPRSVASTNGTDYWMGGAGGGTRYGQQGASTSTQLSATATNVRVTNIFAGQLFFSTSSGAFVGVNSFQGGGTPTASGQTAVNLFGSASGTGTPSAYDFFLADLNPNIPGLDTAYLADDRTVANGGGLQRWDFNGSAWALSYTMSTNLTAGLRGLTASVSGSTVTLFAITADATANKLVRVVDAGAISAFDTLATAPTGEIFRGVDFAPTPAPGPLALLTLGGLIATQRRRR